MFTSIGPAYSRNRQLAGFVTRRDRLRMGTDISTAAIPAGQVAGMRAAEEAKGQPERLHPPEPPTDRAGWTARFRTGIGRRLVRLVDQVSSWDQRRRDRRLLASLDDRTLRDIGIGHSTGESNCITSFWRLR